MFFVIDKSKIVSYIIAICTVVILFVAAAGLNNTSPESTMMTSTNAIVSNEISNSIAINTLTNTTI